MSPEPLNGPYEETPLPPRVPCPKCGAWVGASVERMCNSCLQAGLRKGTLPRAQSPYGKWAL